ncbi:peptidoglycan-binding protein [Ancylothrix sp. C2]|uniref:peptidoglycan-binding domain-containing protein n=1 Tax=Ancylothrix sp. D3o TaxID=2953691 RepID=UPI0021BB51A5|nr:peptidoglycan-binding protein [Ancylothrix sp. D3o]MCT7949469.1 peptidoglycan-binding protein [Ancylothrix sp. D3o]
MQSTNNQSIQSQEFAAQLNKPVLQLGSKGNDVKELQKLLIRWNYLPNGFSIDGSFSKYVQQAVTAFQYRMFLKSDGIVGSLTWKALYTGAPVNMPTLQKGSQGEAVKTLQRALRDAGVYFGAMDGIFGEVTVAAVRTIQKNSGLVADGIVGNKTWYALSKVNARV